MNAVVRRHYPARKLPDDLRGEIDPSKEVVVTVVVEEDRPEHVMSLEEIFALRQPPFLSKEEIDEHIREMREERDG
ncbi:MAG TPA: hypothetical protein VF744_15560 [Beijerinckiaceae bacterium]